VTRPESDVLIDDFLPLYDAYERHETMVAAPIERVYPVVRELDLRRSVLSSAFRLWRGAARRLTRRTPPSGGSHLSLQSFLDHGFVLLAESPPREIVIGLTERVGFGERVRRTEADEFKTFSEPGYAKAAWNFTLVALGPRQTHLATETRVLCLDPRSRRRFRVYWRVIRLFSGLVRVEILRALKKAAETSSAGRGPA
jgi:hypothetical protein